jgi:hypothetical protein
VSLACKTFQLLGRNYSSAKRFCVYETISKHLQPRLFVSEVAITLDIVDDYSRQQSEVLTADDCSQKGSTSLPTNSQSNSNLSEQHVSSPVLYSRQHKSADRAKAFVDFVSF